MTQQPVMPTLKAIGRCVSLDRKLGVGSSGEAWLASIAVCDAPLPPHLLNLPPSFTVKVIHRELLLSERHRQLAEQEVSALQSIHHPNVITYLASWIEELDPYDGCLCIATEYCAGGDLRRLLMRRRERAERFSNDQVMLMAAQLLSAAACCSSRKILHRDIKPANIFVRSSGDGVMLGDFGLSRELEATLDTAESRVGTAYYCSPQIALGDAYTAKTDVWSIGVVLFEVMTFQRPFLSITNNNRQIFDCIVRDDPVPTLRKLCQGYYNNTLLNIVDACLYKSEAERPAALELLTTFSSTMAKFVKANSVPLPTLTKKASPCRKTSPMPERVASPLRGGKPVATATKAPPQVSVQEPSNVPKRVPLRDAADAPHTKIEHQPAAMKVQRVEPTLTSVPLDKVSVLLSSMLEDLPSLQKQPQHTKPRGVAAPTTLTDGKDLLAVLHGDEELFLLMKVMMLSRQASDRAHLEDGLFKLLVALRPEVDADKAIRLATVQR